MRLERQQSAGAARTPRASASPLHGSRSLILARKPVPRSSNSSSLGGSEKKTSSSPSPCVTGMSKNADSPPQMEAAVIGKESLIDADVDAELEQLEVLSTSQIVQDAPIFFDSSDTELLHQDAVLRAVSGEIDLKGLHDQQILLELSPKPSAERWKPTMLLLLGWTLFSLMAIFVKWRLDAVVVGPPPT